MIRRFPEVVALGGWAAPAFGLVAGADGGLVTAAGGFGLATTVVDDEGTGCTIAVRRGAVGGGAISAVGFGGATVVEVTAIVAVGFGGAAVVEAGVPTVVEVLAIGAVVADAGDPALDVDRLRFTLSADRAEPSAVVAPKAKAAAMTSTIPVPVAVRRAVRLDVQIAM